MGRIGGGLIRQDLIPLSENLSLPPEYSRAAPCSETLVPPYPTRLGLGFVRLQRAAYEASAGDSLLKC
jgi:hypothetical protein